MSVTHLHTALALLITITGLSTYGAEILHPAEQYCATYKVSGMEKGTYTVCQRNHSDRYEKYNTKMGFGPFKQSNNKHSIYIKDTIYTLEKGVAKRTTNPMYQRMAEALQDKDPEEVGLAFMQAMGYQVTDEEKDVNGVPCTVYRSQGLGSVCFTHDWIMAEQKVMGQTHEITNLNRDDLGDLSAFDPNAWGVDIEEGPDLNAIFEQLNQGDFNRGASESTLDGSSN